MFIFNFKGSSAAQTNRNKQFLYSQTLSNTLSDKLLSREKSEIISNEIVVQIIEIST
jgi:hypothetical protein